MDNEPNDLRTAAWWHEKRIEAIGDAVAELWPRASYTMSSREKDEWERRLRELGIEVGK